MQVVTSGSEFLDIDAYGGMIAYAELLQLQGEPAMAASSAPLNESITPTIRGWNAPLETQHQTMPCDEFTLIDVSVPEFFDPLVVEDQIVGIIDHHTGYEAYWWERLGDNSRIEFLGAACTLVYEEWQRANKLDEISMRSARLLLIGILDNTLNFEAAVTTDRDQAAYADLQKYADVPSSLAADYFEECQQNIVADLETALMHDAKTMKGNELLPTTFGQLVVWDAQPLLARKGEIAKIMETMHVDWGVNIISIEEGCNYFLAQNPETQAKLTSVLNEPFDGGIARLPGLRLRKEILKRAQELAK